IGPDTDSLDNVFLFSLAVIDTRRWFDHFIAWFGSVGTRAPAGATFLEVMAYPCITRESRNRQFSARSVERGSTESRRTGGGCAGYQDILESHRRLVVRFFSTTHLRFWHNRPLIILRAGRDALAPGSALTLI